VPQLVLGPLLRYVGETEATIWVETDAESEVEVPGHRSRTFRIGGHHYALVGLGGRSPGSVHPYEVLLDGVRRWPDVRSLPSVIRTGEPVQTGGDRRPGPGPRRARAGA